MHKVPAIDEVTRLRMEIETLQLANATLEQQLLTDAEYTAGMLQVLQEQKNELSNINRRLQAQIDFTQSIIDTTSALMIVLDSNGYIRQINRQCRKVLIGADVKFGEVGLDDWLHPEERETILASLPKFPWPVYSPFYEKVRQARYYSAEHRLRGQDGHYYHYLLEASLQINAQGQIEGVVVSATDVTQIIIQQELLQHSEKRLKEAQKIAQLGHWALNMTTDVMTWSEEICSILECKLFSAVHSLEDFMAYVHPDDHTVVQEYLTSSDPSSRQKDIEHRLLFSDGRVKWVHNRFVSYFGETGKSERKVGTIQDITAKHRAEDQLRLAAGVFNNSLNGIMITDPKGYIVQVNHVFCDITGYTLDEVKGRKPSILKSGSHDKQFYQKLWSDIENNGSWQGEIQNRRKNGELYQELLSISAIYNKNRQITQYVGIFTDITEQRQMEDQLRQAQKMEAVGTLVGGIAHDFNNTLAAIQGNLHLAKVYNKDNAAVAAKLDVIEQLGKHTGQTIQQLLTFARKSSVKLNTISLQDLFYRLQQLVDSFVPENITFRLNICTQPLYVNGDENQLQQVMLNLFNNACGAVSDVQQPEVKCSLEAFVPNEKFIQSHPEIKRGQLAHITVTDNGCGIDKQHLPHIFEPFYTTKQGGKGTGLGLSMVYGAIKTHSGVIDPESQLGKGTTIHMYLPTVVAEETGEEVPLEEIAKTEQKHTVLLVDDNVHVRNTYAEALESLDYIVVTADNGIDAVAQFEKNIDHIDLVVCDIVMPIMGGFQAVSKMRKKNNELPAIFMTGYDPDTAIPGDLRDNSQILKKPFSIIKMVESIQYMLSNKKSK